MSKYGSLATISLVGGIVTILFPIVAFFGSVSVIVSSGMSVVLALREKCVHQEDKIIGRAVALSEEGEERL
jgi:hypothetical protein|tara:strand:+ start:337 stop:549 length:213 start_codon:yes stop_codon:yes gene_type:complete